MYSTVGPLPTINNSFSHKYRTEVLSSCIGGCDASDEISFRDELNGLQVLFLGNLSTHGED